jgi:hypothetical protein
MFSDWSDPCGWMFLQPERNVAWVPFHLLLYFGTVNFLLFWSSDLWSFRCFEPSAVKHEAGVAVKLLASVSVQLLVAVQ